MKYNEWKLTTTMLAYQIKISMKAINQIKIQNMHWIAQIYRHPVSNCLPLQWAVARWNSLHWESQCFFSPMSLKFIFIVICKERFYFMRIVAIINCMNWLAKRSYPFFLFRYVNLKWEQISIAIITIQT